MTHWLCRALESIGTLHQDDEASGWLGRVRLDQSFGFLWLRGRVLMLKRLRRSPHHNPRMAAVTSSDFTPSRRWTTSPCTAGLGAEFDSDSVSRLGVRATPFHLDASRRIPFGDSRQYFGAVDRGAYQAVAFEAHDDVERDERLPHPPSVDLLGEDGEASSTANETTAVTATSTDRHCCPWLPDLHGCLIGK